MVHDGLALWLTYSSDVRNKVLWMLLFTEMPFLCPYPLKNSALRNRLMHTRPTLSLQSFSCCFCYVLWMHANCCYTYPSSSHTWSTCIYTQREGKDDDSRRVSSSHLGYGCFFSPVFLGYNHCNRMCTQIQKQFCFKTAFKDQMSQKPTHCLLLVLYSTSATNDVQLWMHLLL